MSIIKVNRNILAHNRRHGYTDPVITATIKGKAWYGDSVCVDTKKDGCALITNYSANRKGPATWTEVYLHGGALTVHLDGETRRFESTEGWSPIINISRERIESKVEGEPVMSLFLDGETHKADLIEAHDAQDELVASVIYAPNEPQKCGAKAWIKVESGCEIQVNNQNQPIAMPGAAIKAGKRFNEWYIEEEAKQLIHQSTTPTLGVFA